MALLTSRICRRIISPLSLSCRNYCEKEITITPEDLLAGKERAEYLAYMAGDDDPYKLRTRKREPNSKSNPIPVPSYSDNRLVGCVCEEDSCHIIWFRVYEGEPRRCFCGHWFKLDRIE